MFQKLIVFTTFFGLLAIIAAQDMAAIIPPRPPTKANATKCFTCDSASSCRQPKTVLCDQGSANTTLLALEKYFSNVPNATNPQFECLRLRYTLEKSVILAVSGCINFGLSPCNLQLKNVTLSHAFKSCDNCSKSLCNPAGTFSSSSAILMSVVFGLLLLLKC